MNQINNDINIDNLNILFMNIERKCQLKPYMHNDNTCNNTNVNHPKRVTISFMKINSCKVNKMRMKLKSMLRRKM